MTIHLHGTFYGRARALSGIRARSRFAGIVAVARMLAAGMTAEQIAASLGASRERIDYLISLLTKHTR